MAKKPTPKPAANTPHPFAHLAGTYQASCNRLYEVTATGTDALYQRRLPREGEQAEDEYKTEARYVENLIGHKAFIRIQS